jgi:hypothetical protein
MMGPMNFEGEITVILTQGSSILSVSLGSGRSVGLMMVLASPLVSVML